MKKLLFTLAVSVFFLSSCEGPQGPPGMDGINILGQTFERTVNFQFNNQNGLQEVLIEIPNSIEVFESDAILVYRLEGQLPDNVDLWSLIPQNFFLGNGDIIQYVYNHSFFDVQIQIDGNFDLFTLGPAFTQNQTFRFVVVPSEFATTSGVDINDYNAVMKALDLD
ncbi:collagen-like protein [uncultured Planktosalinus sp.]|uniref:collagen-like protein n=1 Tax=uncultured Planktosalinus sp. TaxID=1810935 RepID=UPI0030DDBDFA